MSRIYNIAHLSNIFTKDRVKFQQTNLIALLSADTLDFLLLIVWKDCISEFSMNPMHVLHSRAPFKVRQMIIP